MMVPFYLLPSFRPTVAGKQSVTAITSAKEKPPSHPNGWRGRLGLRLHGSKRLIGKLSKGFDFLGYRVVPGRRLRS
ncbi:MAG: hypothetical protein CME15_14640, partial [Gemmatimonadetes bacterium]|nr:hypothetical protein [Gemmatimonadota bacterium]